MDLLNIKKLNIDVPVPGGIKHLVRNVDFSVKRGEVVGLVGASGSGKSISSMAIAGILGSKYIVNSEEITFDGVRLDKCSEKELCSIRGKDIAYVFQEPMTSLNPLLTIEQQVMEPLLLHGEKTSTFVENLEKVKEALIEVGLEPTKSLLNSYPHKLSGGQRQRVMIAMAFICKPQLLVADEITTALDVDTTRVITELLLKEKEKNNTAVIFISHDLKLVRQVSDRVIFMEQGEVRNGLSFDEMEAVLSGKETKNKQNEPVTKQSIKNSANNAGKVILEVNNLDFTYVDRSILGKVKYTPVLHDVNLLLYEGETLGIVGKSGSGKSTLMKCITGLQQSTNGEVKFAEGYGLPQMVFQDPYSSLNPSKTIGNILKESLILGEKRAGRYKNPKTRISKAEIKKRIFDILKEVDLNYEIGYRMISELSGGQRQRVAIACALITRPGIVILDEPVSAVDAAVQGQIIELLDNLKKKFGCSYIFISHDPDVIAKTCDRVLGIKDGTITKQ